jgi:hypothetical protein
LKAAAAFFGAELDGPGDGDRVHPRAQGPARDRTRWGRGAALGCRAHVRRAERARRRDRAGDLLRVGRQEAHCAAAAR